MNKEHELDVKRHCAALSHRLESILRKINIMGDAIQTFATAIQAIINDLNSDVAAVKTEFAALNAQIVAFNNSSGTLTAADQTALDTIQTNAAALQATMDAMVPAVVPPVPPAA